jgi:hypothetical protein
MYALKERGGSGAGADGGTVTVGVAAEAEQDSSADESRCGEVQELNGVR